MKIDHDITHKDAVRSVDQPREIILELKHIHKSYQNVKILKDIHFPIHKGEFVSIVGPSGCGKTTLLRIIKGLTLPDSGKIVYNRKLLKGHEDIGIIFQGPNLLPWRTVEGNIRLPMEINHHIDDSIQEKIDGVIRLTGLNGAEKKYPHQLSGGMKQLAALAKSLVEDDKLILMDEPFASLDPMTREVMAKKVHAIWKETHTTIIFVTHFIDEAVFLSDRIIVLSPKPSRIQCIANTSEFNGGTYNCYRYPVSQMISQLMHPQNGAEAWIEKKNVENRQKKNLLRGKSGYLFSPLIALLIIFLWKLGIAINSYPEFLLPSPETVAKRFIEALTVNQLLMHTSITLFESIVGFIAGFAIGVLMGYPLSKIPFLEKMFYPYITASQTTPIIAIAPLIALWLGFGLSSKVFISALIVLFPVLLTTVTGIRIIDQELGDIMRGHGANRRQTLLKLEIPGSLPYLFATMKVAITLSLIGAVVGEFVSSNRGLGYLVIAAKGVMDTPLLFVTISMLAILGISLYSVIIFFEKVIFRSKTIDRG